MKFITLDISSLKSFSYVVIQFICIGIIAFTGKILPENIFLIFVVILFLLIGIWAMMVMKFNFNISPELIEGTNLKTSGPYGFIRHPMYLSVLGITFSWLLNEWSYFRLIIWLILFFDLILKINFEEKLLNKAFKDFKIYKSKTKKLIPFVF